MLNFNEATLPTVDAAGGTEYDYKAGEWHFDIREDGNPAEALAAAQAWAAWYLFLTKRNEKEARK